MISADALILLSDIDGIYTGHRTVTLQQNISPNCQIDDALRAMAGPAHEDFASGGMVTKLRLHGSQPKRAVIWRFVTVKPHPLSLQCVRAHVNMVHRTRKPATSTQDVDCSWA